MMKTIAPRILSFAILILALGAGSLMAQTPGSLDPTFTLSVSGYNFENFRGRSVDAWAIQTDGKILFGGDFTNVGGVTRSCLARIHADGTLDASFTTLVGWNVAAIVIQDDGKILLGGGYADLHASEHHDIARLNADGTVDGSFNAATFASTFSDSQTNVTAMVVQDDGKIVVGGQFDKVNGSTRKGLVRFNVDGTLDPNFNAGGGLTKLDGSSANSTCMVMREDGKLLIGGNFERINGADHKLIALLKADGTPDPSFDAALDGSPFSMAVQPDGRVIVNGTFSFVNNVEHQYRARLFPDGSLDQTLPSLPLYGPSILQADGKMLLGFGGVMGRLTENGDQDPSFNTDIAGGTVYGLVQQGDGKILIGGAINTVNESLAAASPG